MRLVLHDRAIDLRSGRVTGGPQDGVLREKERQLLAYLVEHLGRTVPRAELYEEVWGYHPETASRTLDSTVRRLRKAVEIDPRRPCHVVSEVGVGYRFVPASQGFTPSPLVMPSLPPGETPYFPRPDDEAAIAALLADEWAVVSLVGPSGVGKSRLAAHVAHARARATGMEVVWIAARETPRSDLVAAIASALAAPSVEPATLRRALRSRRALLVLDEVELDLDAARAVVGMLPGVPILLTSLVRLDLPGEAVHRVQRLSAASGARFLRRRLDASMWNHGVDDAAVARALEVFGGLPLALELAAAHPDGLDALTDAVAEGDTALPPLERALDRAYRLLSAPAVELLHALHVPEVSLSASDLEGWLGRERALALQELAELSLVERDGRRWHLLRGPRRFVAARAQRVPLLRRSYDDWLSRRAVELLAGLFEAPAATADETLHLFDDLFDAIERLPLDEVAEITRLLLRTVDLKGRHALYTRVEHQASLRDPGLPVCRVVRASLGAVSRDTLDALMQVTEPRDQVFAFEVRVMMGPGLADASVGFALAERLDLAAPYRAMARTYAEVAALWTPDGLVPGADLGRLIDWLPSIRRYPTVLAEACWCVAEVLRAQRRYDDALAYLDRALALAREEQLPGLQWAFQHQRARLLGDMDPRLGAEAMLACADQMVRLGGLPAYDRCRAGLLRYVTGDLEEAQELLASGLERVLGETRLLARAVRSLAGARCGRPLPPVDLVVPIDEASELPEMQAFVRDLVEAERSLLEGRAEVARQQVDALRDTCRELCPRIQQQLLIDLGARVEAVLSPEASPPRSPVSS